MDINYNHNIESRSVKIGHRLLHLIQHWNPNRYWKRRAYVVVEDIPDGGPVVLNNPRIISKNII